MFPLTRSLSLGRIGPILDPTHHEPPQCAGMGPDSDYDPNKAIGDPNNNLYPDQIGNIRAIRRHADALLPAKGKAPCLPRSVLSQRRCLANWDISADVLAVLRPSGGSEKYFRQLQILSTRVGWDDARDRLRAAVASRIANIGRGISSDTQVAVADVTAVLRDLGPEKPASPVPYASPQVPFLENRLDC